MVFAQEADHLLLTRIVTQPDAAESFSIYNPTDSPVNLAHYYICDDKEYYKMQTEGDMSPSSNNSGFTVQFPDISISPGDTFHIVLNEDYKEFYGEDFVADLVMFGSSDSSLTGSIGFSSNKIDEIDELIILFKWDGESDQLIKDVDYFLWSSLDGVVNVVDKTGIVGIDSYADDTALDNQLYFESVAGQNYAYSRIGTDEVDEIQNDSNGINGHDETNENFRESWTIIRISEFIYGCTDIYAINYNPLAEYEIDTYYELKTGIYEYNSSLSCRYSFKQIINNEFGTEYSDMVVYGRVVDFFDIRTVSESGSGPQNITIEDENGYRITITVWDWEVADSEISEAISKYNKNMFYVWAAGDLGFYEDGNEWQVEVASSENIIIAQNFTSDGEYESSSTPIKTSINPAPFIIIPTLDETLDYNFTFPEKSRVIIRIFDISGRFITSLVDQYYELSGTVYCNDPPASWDGRDHLGQIVAAGTYIMHIEALNPATGETHTDAAPVVVGVKN